MPMDCTGSVLHHITKASLKEGKLVATEDDENVLPKFDTKEAENDHIAELKHWEKNLYEDENDDFWKFSFDMRRDLSFAHISLHSTFHVSLRNRLEVDAEHQKMAPKKPFNATMLCQCKRKIFNSSTCAAGEDVLGNLMKSLCNFFLIR